MFCFPVACQFSFVEFLASLWYSLRLPYLNSSTNVWLLAAIVELQKECELELREKGEMVSRLQTKAAHISHILTSLEQCPNPNSPTPTTTNSTSSNSSAANNWGSPWLPWAVSVVSSLISTIWLLLQLYRKFWQMRMKSPGNLLFPFVSWIDCSISVV